MHRQGVVCPVDIAPLEGMFRFELLDEVTMPAQTAAKRMVISPLRSGFQRLIHLPDGHRSPRQIRRQAAATLAAEFGLADVLLIGVNPALLQEALQVCMP